MPSIRTLLPAALALATALPLAAQEWTRFRGPNGTGISPAKNLPATWTENDFRWRVPIAGASHSQPVIWGDRLFLLTASTDSRERSLLCLDKNTGRELWAKTYELPTHRPGNKNSGYANGSAVVDAERVIACFVSEDQFWVRAFDHAGQERWSRNLGPFKSQHGHGASPMIFEKTVIVTNDQDGESFVVALDLKTGTEAWRAPRHPGRNPNIAAAYCTPVLHQPPGSALELLLTSQAHGVSSIDPRTGAANWEAPVFDKRMIASPVVAGDLVIGSCGSGGGASNYLSAIRLGGKGNVAKTHVAYTLRTATPYVPTPLYLDGRLYTISDAGIASALEAATGKTIWAERLRAEFFSSPVLADGKIYVPSVKGEMIVFTASDTFQLIARNPLGEGTHSTPCLDGGRIYVKTFTHLVCVGAK
ncbi:MAG: PQQ-binding-like beta-propeller repeat protein [Verrucomicrobia bacterium]|nr:PQQ-binding-like beta-propeller repeat protein [Verrucomicrobiota bacterium]